jgi:competence protein ComFC
MSFQKFLNSIINLLLPQRCLSCRKFGEIICDDCLYKLPNESSVYGITTLFPYSDPTIQRAIWLLKYKGVKEVVKPLAKALHERLIEDLSSLMELSLENESKIVLIPVPLSKEREHERGFNQSAVLAKELVNIDDGQSFELWTDILKKTRHTQSQVTIKNKSERLKNLQGAFSLENKEVIKDRIVVLLDDVTTTGTTLNECAKVLRRAKPRHIIKVALAH